MTLELKNEDDEEMDVVDIDAACERQGPLILLGGFPEASVEDLLEAMPPRPSADRLVTKFFQLEEPAWSKPISLRRPPWSVES